VLAHGLGADRAPGHTEGKAPGEAPVSSDSGSINIVIEAGASQPREKGISGVKVDSKHDEVRQARMKQILECIRKGKLYIRTVTQRLEEYQANEASFLGCSCLQINSFSILVSSLRPPNVEVS